MPRCALLLALALALGPAGTARAERLEASVRNDRDEPLADAVVYAVPLSGAPPPPPSEPVVIDQIDKEFVPRVTAVPVGARIVFPNRDGIRHHVYSFSEAKTFEIPLYKGMPAEPVDFDRRGEVVLGCNIHDWMKAYVFVAETPYLAVTDDRGEARLELPAGDYRVHAWHPRQRGDSEATATKLAVPSGEGSRVDFSIEEEPVWNARRAPSSRDPSYR